MMSSVVLSLAVAAPARAQSSVLNGIDVSNWQGTIDWNAVAQDPQNIKFAIIKATEGRTYTDPYYASNKSNARAAGIRNGAYHFARPDTTANDAVLEADNFVSVAKVGNGDLLPALDLEDNGGLGVQALINWTQVWLNEVVGTTGVKPMIYASPNFWQNSMGNTTQFADEGFDVLWIAHWTSNSQPTVPANNWGGHGWTFWQWSDCINVSGIPSPNTGGCVDGDRYNGLDMTRVTVSTAVQTAGPSRLDQGATDQNLVLYGRGFQDGATVSFSGSGVQVNSVAPTFGATLTANLTIDPTAPPGMRIVSVTNPDGSSGACTCFAVGATSRFHPVAPTRIASGLSISTTSDRSVTIAGTAGIPTSATAVLVNVEVYRPSTAGYLRVTPKGSPSATAVQEFGAGQTVSTLAAVQLGSGGAITLHLSAGTASLYLDVEGWYADSSDTTGDLYAPLAPARIAGGVVLSSGHDQNVTVLGVGGVPASGVDAVIVNVEVSSPSVPGYLRVIPAGADSTTGVQEFAAGQTISNLVTVPPGNGGAISLHLSAGSARVYVDVQGYYAPSAGDPYHPMPSTRFVSGLSLTAGSDRDVTLAGSDPIPGSGVSAVVFNVEIWAPSAGGYLRIVPKGSPSGTAVQEFAAGQTISNLVTLKVGAGGAVTLHLSAGSARIYLDVQGYFGTA